MTGAELKAIRIQLGLGRAAFGAALGYRGTPHNLNSLIGNMERDGTAIAPWIARLATMYARFGIPADLDPGKLNWGKKNIA